MNPTNHNDKTADDTSEDEFEYLSIFRNGCQYLDKDQTGSLCLPRFTPGGLSIMDSLEYRTEMSRQFQLGNNTHVLCYEWFRESDLSFGFVILEVASEEMISKSRLVPVEMMRALDLIQKTCQHSIVYEHLRGFSLMSMSLSPRKCILPWYHLGYWKSIIPFIDKSLESCDEQRLKEPEQFVFSFRSVVYRISMPNRYLYLKGTRPGSNEVSKNRLVSQLFPENTPKMIDIGTDFDAFITYDFGLSIGDLCRRSPATDYEDSAKINALVQRQWASAQQCSAKHLDELRKAKMPVHDAKWIREGFKAITMFLSEQSLLSADEQKYFSSSESFVEHTLSLWNKSGLSNTLVHGDLHEGNVAQPDGPGSSFIFFDWESAYIGFPFLDIGDQSLMGGCLFNNVDAYQDCWTSYAGLKTVEELVVFTKPIAFLVCAISQMMDESMMPEDRKRTAKDNAEWFIESIKNLENYS